MIYIEHAMQKPRDLTCNRSVNMYEWGITDYKFMIYRYL